MRTKGHKALIAVTTNRKDSKMEDEPVEKSLVYRCGGCGYLEIEDEILKANDPWCSDGGPVMYCGECGEVDNMVEIEVPDEVYAALIERPL